MLEELQSIVGRDRVTADPAELYCYSFDSSYIRGQADYVVRPKNTEEIAEIVKLAARKKVPIVPRGSASGLTGGSVPVKGGIVFDMANMNRILEIEIENLQAVIEPGVIHRDLNNELIRHGFFFPPDPGSSDMCTVGGLIANGGSGMHSVKYGTVKDYVLDLEVVLPNGDIINTGCKAPKTSSGYDLTRLFVGSEGTLGIITKARLKIYPLPETKSIVMANFDRIEDAGRAAVATLSSGVIPAAMEIMDGSAISAVKQIDPTLDIPDVEAMLLFEVDGYKESVARQVEMVCSACEKCNGRTTVAKNKKEEEKLWSARRLVGVAITKLNPGKVRVYEAEDIGVPIKDVPFMLKKIQEIGKKHGMPLVTYGHIGDGNLHTGIAIDQRNEEEWKKVHAIKDDIYDIVLTLGGTLPGEHGTGVIRGSYMTRAHGKSYEVMKTIKRAIDPENIMNPGKMGM
ncbi:FAD-binding protein [Methanocella sp. CWC-04]|uniref:FAD-binding protein n=1 Tax=Methanooceanicella nereidis TaxID=2052831 RepID=A0AAP2RDU4_9EURY|nr:FAD-linked oxidase C-terminal domain-containing protein [Methanocella sp. CWC-04]MCD1294235.1 FAD-binding protein [Methanocella sp. CWC-04]